MNKKTNGIISAKQQFLQDLQNDTDFLIYKQKGYNEKERRNYGTINATQTRYELNLVGLATESLISQYKKQISCQ